MVRKVSLQFLAVVVFGAVCQVSQVVLLRELLMVFHGNELSIGIILAAWLAWGGIGSRLGAAEVGPATMRRQRLADRAEFDGHG
ncbi:MAG: hypothetical protein N3E40_02240, partial [Dehalococcoidia bacterium]|nr:hypothetical protein [Dehalococcoidia bacterium]